MRTTIDLDDDVAAAVQRLRRQRSLGLSEAVNELMRAGLVQQEQPRSPFIQKTYSMGVPAINIDNIAEVIEWAEGPEHK